MFVPRSDLTQTYADLIPPLEDLLGLLQFQKLPQIWQDLCWNVSILIAKL